MLKFCVEDFLQDRNYRNLSPATIDIYTRVLNMFQVFCTGAGITNARDIDKQTFKKYLLYLKERGNNPRSQNTHIQHLRVFFNYLTTELEVFAENANPAKKIGYMQIEDKLEVYSEQQIKQILAYFRKQKNRGDFLGHRNYVIILTLTGTGIRLGELASITWNNIDFTNGLITVYGKKRSYSSLPLYEKLTTELGGYKALCEERFGNLSDMVFVSDQNRPVSQAAIQNMLKRLAKVMGFRINAHQFRHYFAKQWILNGGDSLTLQRILRHSNLSTTQRYVNLWGTALASQNDLYNPLENM